MEQVVKDNHGNVIGRVRDCGGNEIIMMDAHGNIVGRYKKSSDETFDGHGKKVGKGNLLEQQLKK